MSETRDIECFRDWESRTFGAGYGTGELPILRAVLGFFATLKDDRSYDYRELEAKLGDTVTWLLINAFDKAHIIEWGTSARFGWLTACGEFLRDFLRGKTAEELYEMLGGDPDDIPCQCDGKHGLAGHEDCARNPFVHEKYANALKYGRPPSDATVRT